MSQTEVKDAKVEEKKDLKAQEKQAPKAKKVKANKGKKQRKGFRWFKEMGSELKKVTWPKFSTVCKQTGIVLAFIVGFGIVLFGFDYLLKFLFNLLISK